MDYTYIRKNSYKVPNNKEEFLVNFEATCNAFGVDFNDGNDYKPMSSFLIELFGALIKYQREDGNN